MPTHFMTDPNTMRDMAAAARASLAAGSEHPAGETSAAQLFSRWEDSEYDNR